MNNATIIAYKKVGETPLDVIRRIKTNKPLLSTQTISYAGRLDPMAEGLLLLLVGDENKKRKVYENLTKTYSLEILIGLSTDSYDLLGLLTNQKLPLFPDTKRAFEKLTTFQGVHSIPYPPYSSKPVNGKPLYFWARNNLLESLTIPEKEVTISSLKVSEIREITGKEVSDYALEKISLIKGDFRQEEIIKQWKDFATKHFGDTYFIMKVEISCTSGTYMRSIAHLLGPKIGIPTLAFSITRMRIGDFTTNDISNLDDQAFVK